MGSGINRVKTIMKDKIEFEITEEWFRVVINREKVNASVNAPVKLSKLQQNILNQIKNNNKITYNNLAVNLKANRTTIMRNIAKLKKLKIIQRIGADKSGHWVILK
jgi:predicted HTH transcriptional regulator